MDKPNLDKDKKLIIDTLRKLKSEKDLNNFLDDLLTEEEILDLAQRIKIGKLILDGKSYDEISEKIGTSTSTVSKIGQILKYGKGGLEKTLGKDYFLKIRVYPFHVLREHALASGAGADRLSTGMARPYGKAISSAARVRDGQILFELRINKANLKLARDSLGRAAKKLPCTCKSAPRNKRN